MFNYKCKIHTSSRTNVSIYWLDRINNFHLGQESGSGNQCYGKIVDCFCIGVSDESAKDTTFSQSLVSLVIKYLQTFRKYLLKGTLIYKKRCTRDTELLKLTSSSLYLTDGKQRFYCCCFLRIISWVFCACVLRRYRRVYLIKGLHTIVQNYSI